MSYISKNIRQLRKLNKLSQMQLASLLGVSRTNVTSWETGNNYPGLELIIKIAGIFDISLDDLLTTDVSENSTSSVVSEAAPVYQKRKNNLFVPVKAQAGYVARWPDEQLLEEAQYIQVPGIEQEARTFEIEGQSMVPMIHPGDYLVCTRVEQTDEIKEGVIYLLVTRDQGILAKFIRLHADGLELISANHVDYRPYIIPLGEVREIWRARMKITAHFEPGNATAPSSNMLQRLGKMERFMAEMFPDFLEK